MGVEIYEKYSADKINYRQIVNITEMCNGTIEIEHLANTSNGLEGIKKISGNCFVDKTGVVSEYKFNENRAQSAESVRKSLKKARRLICNNFFGEPNELSITLTYGKCHMILERGWITEAQEQLAWPLHHYSDIRENKTIDDYRYYVVEKYTTPEQMNMVIAESRSTAALYEDLRKFMQRFKYKYEWEFGKMEYIWVKEPQGIQNNNAWHVHLLVKFVDVKKVPVVDIKAEVQSLWRLGFTKCRSIKDSNKIASYLSKYDGNERLHLYPSGTRLFSKSLGMVYPETKRMKYIHAIRRTKGKGRSSSKSYEIIDKGTGACLNTYTVEQYQD